MYSFFFQIFSNHGSILSIKVLLLNTVYFFNSHWALVGLAAGRYLSFTCMVPRVWFLLLSVFPAALLFGVITYWPALHSSPHSAMFVHTRQLKVTDCVTVALLCVFHAFRLNFIRLMEVSQKKSWNILPQRTPILKGLCFKHVRTGCGLVTVAVEVQQRGRRGEIWVLICG